jgi:ankyrin repeat protein
MIKFHGDLNNEVNELLLSAVRLGDSKSIKNHLSTIQNPEIYLNRIYDEPHKQKCTLLMIACLNKHEDMVRLLLNYDNVDIEVLNDIQLMEQDQNLWMFEDVTILWAAAAIDNLELVKLLVEHGARINHITKTNSTALRCACCNGNIDIARYLIKNGADVHIAKINNETNLIASVFNEDLKITTYLLDELGCDVNECIGDGRSPLYVATDRGSLELVQLLLSRGARNGRVVYDQMSPLTVAAEKGRSDLVDAIALIVHCSNKLKQKNYLVVLLSVMNMVRTILKSRLNASIEHLNCVLNIIFPKL